VRTTTLCPKIGWHGSRAKLCPNLDRIGALNDVVPLWLLPFGWFPHNRIKMQISTLAVALWLTCHYTTELSGIWALHHRYLSRLFWWSCRCHWVRLCSGRSARGRLPRSKFAFLYGYVGTSQKEEVNGAQRRCAHRFELSQGTASLFTHSNLFLGHNVVVSTTMIFFYFCTIKTEVCKKFFSWIKKFMSGRVKLAKITTRLLLMIECATRALAREWPLARAETCLGSQVD